MSECYFLSGRRAHFHRFCDGSFRDKWTGFWIYNRKFLDYFAFQIDNEWLSPENFKSFEFLDYSSRHLYDTHLGKVVEEIKITDGEEFDIFLKSPKSRIILEVGINIRDKSENWHDRTYEILSKGKLYTFLSLDKLNIEFNKPARIVDVFYKNHMNDQRCMVVKFETTAKNLRVNVFRERGKPVKRRMRYKDENLRLAALSLDMLIKDNDFYAGLPWFLETWGRDLGWSIPALLDLRWFEQAKKILERILDASKENVPNILNPPDYFSADATPLVIISLKKYVDATGDRSIIDKYEEKINGFLKWYRQHRDEYGFFKNDMGELFDARRGSTWMDTIHRPRAVDVQALWIRALKSLKNLGFDVDLSIEENFEEFYWNGEYYVDNLSDERSITPNMLVPVILGISKHPREVLKVVEEKLSTPHGILTLSKDDPNFSFQKYHQGQIWSLTTGWMTLAEYMYGTKGDYYLNILCESQKKCIPGVGETFDDNGNVLGCRVQAWGSAMIVRAIKEFKNQK